MNDMPEQEDAEPSDEGGEVMVSPAMQRLIDVLVDDLLHEQAVAGDLPKQYLRPVVPPPRVCLYRHFDITGALLYVGISVEPKSRIYGHARAHWYADIVRTTEQWFDDRKVALTAELAAIKSENPLHNKQGMPRR